MTKQRERLFATDEVEKWKGGKALVPVDTSKCPQCTWPVVTITIDERALLRGGGYGATRQTVTDYCTHPACTWRIRRSVTEVNPR